MRNIKLKCSLCTTLSVRYSAEMIAFGAVFAASEALGEILTTPHGTPWWDAKRLKQKHLKGAFD
jgi:hypothetical protein